MHSKECLILDMLIDKKNEIAKIIKICSRKYSLEDPGMKNLIKFLVIGEDKRFYFHHGIDVLSIIRAIYKNIFQSCHEGASTIDQQLVRVITGDYSYTLVRKIKEMFLAIWMDNKFSKNIIALTYLTISYYGTNYYNLALILKRFHERIDKNIDNDICAEIIARLKYPEPRKVSITWSKKIAIRREYILRLKTKYHGK